MKRFAFAVLLALVTGTAFAQSGKTEVLWLGQAAFRITTPGGKVIVIDPFMRKNPKTPPQFKDLHSLGKVDMILVTHAHGDHFSDAPDLAKLNNAPVYNAGGLGRAIVTLGYLPANLAPRFGMGGSITPFGPDGVKITATHADHASELEWKNPATGKEETHFGGEPVGYVIRMENGFTIYHAGDTGLFGDMAMIGEYLKPDLVLLPIGGHFTMGPAEAAIAVNRYLKPKFVIPMHYGTYPILKGTPDEFKAALGNTSTKVIVPQPGEKTDF